MNPAIQQKSTDFVDRRQSPTPSRPDGGVERRQFRDSHDALAPEVSELAEAVDQYKLMHRRRFITFEELYGVIRELGYEKQI